MKSNPQYNNATKGNDDVAKVEALAKKLDCTTPGVFHRAARKYLSHLKIESRQKVVETAIKTFFNAIKENLPPPIPRWVKSFINYMFKKDESGGSAPRKHRRSGRRSRGAYA